TGPPDQAPGSVLLLRNNENGAFGLSGVLGLGDLPISIASGDLDGDRDEDLLVLASYHFPEEESLGIVFVMENLGLGHFELAAFYSVKRSPSSFTVKDLDGDGDIDVAVSSTGSASVSILLNTGKGAFEPALNLDAGDTSLSVAALDADGDGDLDLAA